MLGEEGGLVEGFGVYVIDVIDGVWEYKRRSVVCSSIREISGEMHVLLSDSALIFTHISAFIFTLMLRAKLFFKWSHSVTLSKISQFLRQIF